MRKLFAICLALGLLSSACGGAGGEQTAGAESTWQEQYDLGVRYLSEGNYEEAIIAFSAAIEIDPKRAEGYVGLADAYLGLGDTEKAAKAIADGIAACGETELFDRFAYLNGSEPPEETAGDGEDEHETVEVTGSIFLIYERYYLQIQELSSKFGDPDSGTTAIIRHHNCGVEFAQPVTAVIDGQEYQVTQAELDQRNITESELYTWTDAGQEPGQLIGKQMRMRGYFMLNDQQEEVEGPKSDYAPGMPAESPLYDFQPMGSAVFVVTEYGTE